MSGPDPNEPDIDQDDTTAFVVYVPPHGSDTTFESCLRLGAAPGVSNQNATTDEKKTYSDAASAAHGLTGLSWETYNPTAGIALVTPGTINLVAAQGVNMTSGSSFTNSTTGTSYTVIQGRAGGPIVSATLTDGDTSTFNTTNTVSINTTDLLASIGVGMMYGVTGPLTCSNTWGAAWSSTVGLSVTSTFAKVINVGLRTVVSNAFDGSNNEYYTAAQAASTAATFTWKVPTEGYASFDAMQKIYCALVAAAAAATSVAAAAYAAAGAIHAARGRPSEVQAWLKKAQTIGMTCTIIDGILCAAGLVLGILTDVYTDDDAPMNVNATSFILGKGSAELKTKKQVTGAPGTAPALLLDADQKMIILSLDDVFSGAALILDGKEKMITLGTTDKAQVTLMDDCLILEFGETAKIRLDAQGVHLHSGGSGIDVTSSEIKIAGPNVTTEGTMIKITSLQAEIAMVMQGIAAIQTAAATVWTTVKKAMVVAQTVSIVAGVIKRAIKRLTAGRVP